MPHDSHCRSERRTAARPVNAVLDLFEGDANATIGAMLAELQFVRRQLALCEAGVSVGFTRGWIPSFDREGDGNVEYSREPRPGEGVLSITQDEARALYEFFGH